MKTKKAIKIKSIKHGQKVKKEFVRLGIDVYDCKFNIFDYYYYSFNNLTHFSPSIPPGYEEITLKQLKQIGISTDLNTEIMSKEEIEGIM